MFFLDHSGIGYDPEYDAFESITIYTVVQIVFRMQIENCTELMRAFCAAHIKNTLVVVVNRIRKRA